MTVTFEDLLKRKHYIYKIALKFVKKPEVAEDITQMVLAKCYEKACTIVDEAAIKSWLFITTRNTACNTIREFKRELPIDPFIFPDLVDTKFFDTSLEENIVTLNYENYLQSYVNKLVTILPKRQKEALLLRMEGLSFLEVAEIMKCPYDTAKANYRHAIMKLKKLMEGEHYDSCIEEFIPRPTP